MKKLLLTTTLLALAPLSTLAATISFDPQFKDSRFEPADKLHATCDHIIDLYLDPQGDAIQATDLTINYDSNAIDIVNIHTQSVLNNDLTKSITPKQIKIGGTTRYPLTDYASIAQLKIKSKVGVTESMFSITDSTVTTKAGKQELPIAVINLEFASVSECDPDITPPAITLIEPRTGTGRVNVNTPISFRVSDSNKGVQRANTVIDINGTLYKDNDPAVSITDDIITVQPTTNLPHGTGITATLLTEDKQSFGGANKASETITFNTTREPVACMAMGCQANYITEEPKFSLTKKECKILGQQYKASQNETILSIFEKGWCPTALLSIITGLTPNNTPKDTIETSSPIQGFHNAPYRGESTDTTHTTKTPINLLALIGWALFAVTFGLKIIYMIKYKHHKNKNHHNLFDHLMNDHT